MISFEKNFLFIHVPKTGGNSFTDRLIGFCDDKKVCDRVHRDGKQDFALRNSYGLRKHAGVSEWSLLLGEKRFRAFFKFTIIRNPWDRLMSHFMHQQRKTGRDDGQFNPGRFARWLHNARIFDQFCLWNGKKSWSLRGGKGIYPFDFYVRFDCLQEDWLMLSALLDIPQVPLEHLNKGADIRYRHLYTPETYKLVARRCASEIEYFNYRF